MKILPQLNLNKHPQDVENGSLISAVDMMCSNDNSVLQTEQNFTNHHLTELFKEVASDDFQIISCIPCNNELVIFVTNNNVNSIYRYNEKADVIKYCCDFIYSGGTIIGTFTYNFNNLIIAFSEYFEDDSKNVPLKTINLGNFDSSIDSEDSNQLNNTKYHSICPEIILPKLTINYKYGAAYKGWYYIFIRYKISTNTYTQWFNTNKSIFVDYFNDDYIFNYYISPDANGKREENGIYHSFAQSILSDNTEISKITFECQVGHSVSIYDYYQLGFINIHKSTSRCFKTNDISIDSTNFIFKNSNVEEYSIENIITSYSNYYNVKSLTTVGNRLFIGNYKENDLDKSLIDKLKDINVTIRFGFTNYNPEQTSELDIATAEYINETYGSFTRICQKYNGDFWYYNAVNAICEANVGDSNGKVVAHEVYNLTEISESYPLTVKYKLPNENYVEGQEIQQSWFTEYEESILAKNIIIAPFIQYFDDIGNVCYGKVYIIKDGALVDCSVGGPLNNQVRFQHVGDGRVQWDKFIVQSTSYSTNVNPDPDLNLNENYSFTSHNVINRLNSCGIYPGQPYNFFIHFVNKYGEISRGYNLSNFNVTTDANKGYNSLGNLIIFSPNADYHYSFYKVYTANIFIDNLLDDNIVGYFVSYEKLEKCIQYKGYLTQASNGAISFYSDELNFADSITFDFNKVRLRSITDVYANNSTKTNINLNYNYQVVNTEYQEVEINNVIFKVADSFNNILQSTHLELTLSQSVDTIDKIAELYKDDGFNYYNNESKILIPCSDISSPRQITDINTKTAFISKHHAIVYNKVYFNDTLKIFQKENSSDAEYNIFKHVTWFDYAEVPWESLRYNNKPVVTFFPIKGIDTANEKEKTFQLGNIVECKNTIDLYQQVNTAVGDNYPRSLDWYNPNANYENNYPKTIRRSNIIQDESHTNSWRQFEVEQYKNIIENKGDIIKLISIGYYFIVHCQHSMFLFNGTDSIAAKENDIQLSSVDFWDTQYKEIVTSDLGYAGIQQEYAGISGNFGYIFFDSDRRRFYRYDNSSIELIDSNIHNFIRKLHGYVALFVDDKQNNRLIIKLTDNKNSHFVLSYNYNINKFVSSHSYDFLKGYSTKENIYMIGNNANEFNYFGDIYSAKSSVGIMINTGYVSMKTIDAIQYKVEKVKDNPVGLDYSILPVEGLDDKYSGDLLRVYSTHCDTGLLDVTFGDTEDTTVNQFGDYVKPYWRLGNWHFNCLRNKLVDYIAGNITAFDSSRVFGNWFVVQFVFKTNNRVELESIDAKFSDIEYDT